MKVEYSVDGKQWTTDPSTITATNVKDSKTIKVRASVPGVYAGYAETTQKLTITERLVTVTGDGWDAYQPYTGKSIRQQIINSRMWHRIRQQRSVMN